MTAQEAENLGVDINRMDESLKDTNSKLIEANERAEKLLKKNDLLFVVIEEHIDHVWYEVKTHINWALTHPKAYKRLIESLCRHICNECDGPPAFWPE